jgi:hypothetical protein
LQGSSWHKILNAQHNGIVKKFHIKPNILRCKENDSRESIIPQCLEPSGSIMLHPHLSDEKANAPLACESPTVAIVSNVSPASIEGSGRDKFTGFLKQN